MIFQANRIQNQAGVSICISDKFDFKLKLIRREKEGHYILIKETIHQDTMFVNMCVTEQ
jgi:hypothetical protein